MSSLTQNDAQSKDDSVQNGSSASVNIPQKSTVTSTGSCSTDTPLPKNNKGRKYPGELKEEIASIDINTVPQHIMDAHVEKFEVLKAKYPGEFNSWRSRQNWAKKNKVAFAPEFDRFADFLEFHGPKPEPTYTLDRIDNKKGYIPGNTRWASKTEQSANRSNVKRHYIDGEEIPQPDIAHALGVTPDALRKKLSRGASILDVIAKRVSATEPKPKKIPKTLGEWPWPPDCEDKWERAYQARTKSEENRLAFFISYSNAQVDRTRSFPEPMSPKHMAETEFWLKMRKLAKVTVDRAEREYFARNALGSQSVESWQN